jgi:hypothetical protein
MRLADLSGADTPLLSNLHAAVSFSLGTVGSAAYRRGITTFRDTPSFSDRLFGSSNCRHNETEVVAVTSNPDGFDGKPATDMRRLYEDRSKK